MQYVKLTFPAHKYRKYVNQKKLKRYIPQQNTTFLPPSLLLLLTQI